MSFDRESGVPPQDKKPEPYPKNLTELSEEVFSLIYKINSFLRANRIPNEEDRKSVDQGYKTIVREIFELYKDPDAKTNTIKSWQEGLDILRDNGDELDQIAAEKIMEVPELEIQDKNKRQKLFFQRLNLAEARIKKIDLHAGLGHILKNMRRDFLRATNDLGPEQEKGAWIALKILESYGDDELKNLEKLLREIREESDE
jgi:hypothetical protein